MPSQEEMSRRESLSSPTSSAAFAWDIIRSKVYFGFCWSRGRGTRIPGVEGPGDTGADGVELQDVTDALFQGWEWGWGQGGWECTASIQLHWKFTMFVTCWFKNRSGQLFLKHTPGL